MECAAVKKRRHKKSKHNSMSVIEATVLVEPIKKKRDALTMRRLIKRRNHKENDVLDVPSLLEQPYYPEPLVERPIFLHTASPISSYYDVASEIVNDTNSNERNYNENNGNTADASDKNIDEDNKHNNDNKRYECDIPKNNDNDNLKESNENSCCGNSNPTHNCERHKNHRRDMATLTDMVKSGGESHGRAAAVYANEVAPIGENVSLAAASPRPATWDSFQKWQEYASSQSFTNTSTLRGSERRRKKLRASSIAKNVGSILENLGRVAVDFFIHLCHLTSKAISYQGPIGVLLILTCIYYSIIYLELSLANSAEVLLEWVWPAIHVTLRGVERVLRTATNFVHYLDELGESIICDWAQLWCAQFELMCHQRCSFTSKTLDRFRH